MKIYLNVDQYQIYNSRHERLLGITVNNMTFDEHVSRLLYKKVSQKLHALARVSNSMNVGQRKIMKAFIASQFGYCPVVWMFHSRMLNNRINKIHEGPYVFVYKDFSTTFEELLQEDGSFTIHERNIQDLAIELYKLLMAFLRIL